MPSTPMTANRRLVPHYRLTAPAIIEKLACSDCEWDYPIQEPRAGCLDTEVLEAAAKKFLQHECRPSKRRYEP